MIGSRGGRGGLGNAALASPRRKAPGFALLGEPGEHRDVVLELKTVADVALVGFPSAGKSSLIAAMSAARPKIADYPFTTLVPNLGVVTAGEVVFTVADVPGLIPGASQGKGLGLEFLRHVERCHVLVHVLDCATLDPGRDPISDLEAIEHELEQYGGTEGDLADRPRLVALNKIDEVALIAAPGMTDLISYNAIVDSAVQMKDRVALLDAVLRAVFNVKTDDVATIYYAGSLGELQRLARSARVAGFYRADAQGAVGFIPEKMPNMPNFVGAAMTPERIMFHEYTHHMLLSNSGKFFPAWATEGLAELFMTATLISWRAGVGRMADSSSFRKMGVVVRASSPVSSQVPPASVHT